MSKVSISYWSACTHYLQHSQPLTRWVCCWWPVYGSRCCSSTAPQPQGITLLQWHGGFHQRDGHAWHVLEVLFQSRWLKRFEHAEVLCKHFKWVKFQKQLWFNACVPCMSQLVRVMPTESNRSPCLVAPLWHQGENEPEGFGKGCFVITALTKKEIWFVLWWHMSARSVNSFQIQCVFICMWILWIYEVYWKAVRR